MRIFAIGGEGQVARSLREAAARQQAGGAERRCTSEKSAPIESVLVHGFILPRFPRVVRETF